MSNFVNYDNADSLMRAINKLKTQVSTMPTASATNLGHIVQYIGTTTSSYTLSCSEH